jgi:hypothetical protein
LALFCGWGGGDDETRAEKGRWGNKTIEFTKRVNETRAVGEWICSQGDVRLRRLDY